MTLCAIWRKGPMIQIATDSRLNFGSSSTDIAIKLMALPVRVYDSTLAGSGEEPLLRYNLTLGIATVGSVTSTHMAKQYLENVLGSLQHAQGVADDSLRGIAEVCARVLCAVSREVCRVLYRDGQGQLVLTGWCPVLDRPRAFLLTVTADTYPVDVRIEEILENDGSMYMGSGSATAQKYQSETSEVFPYHIVRRVALDPAEPTVGGNPQFGVVDAKGFRVMGVRDYEVNDELKEIYTGFYLGGLEMHGGESLLGDMGYAMKWSYLAATESDIRSYVARGYTPVTRKDHW